MRKATRAIFGYRGSLRHKLIENTGLNVLAPVGEVRKIRSGLNGHTRLAHKAHQCARSDAVRCATAHDRHRGSNCQMQARWGPSFIPFRSGLRREGANRVIRLRVAARPFLITPLEGRFEGRSRPTISAETIDFTCGP